MVSVGIRSLAFGCLINALPLIALDNPTQRTITVTGESEVKVNPDEVVVTVGIETRNKDLSEVRKLNDQKAKKLVANTISVGVASKDIKTDYLNLQPEYHESSLQRTFLAYVQKTTIVISLRDVSKFEALVTSTLQAGAEYIHGIEFRTSELRKHRDEARALAIKAAKEKATALANELGQKIGAPRSIQEGQAGYWSSYGGWWGHGYQNMSQNFVQIAGSNTRSQDNALAPGQLSVRASVTVTFDLE
jgi:uncharacterized protein YggE